MQGGRQLGGGVGDRQDAVIDQPERGDGAVDPVELRLGDIDLPQGGVRRRRDSRLDLSDVARLIEFRRGRRRRSGEERRAGVLQTAERSLVAQLCLRGEPVEGHAQLLIVGDRAVGLRIQGLGVGAQAIEEALERLLQRRDAADLSLIAVVQRTAGGRDVVVGGRDQRVGVVGDLGEGRRDLHQGGEEGCASAGGNVDAVHQGNELRLRRRHGIAQGGKLVGQPRERGRDGCLHRRDRLGVRQKVLLEERDLAGEGVEPARRLHQVVARHDAIGPDGRKRRADRRQRSVDGRIFGGQALQRLQHALASLLQGGELRRHVRRQGVALLGEDGVELVGDLRRRQAIQADPPDVELHAVENGLRALDTNLTGRLENAAAQAVQHRSDGLADVGVGRGRLFGVGGLGAAADPQEARRRLDALQVSVEGRRDRAAEILGQ